MPTFRVIAVLMVASSFSTFPAPAESLTWKKRMREMAATLGDLMVDVNSDSRWNDPRNRKRVQEEANRLAALAHGLEGKSALPPDRDQTLQIIGSLFADESRMTAKLLDRGYYQFARNRLRAAMGYCMACHTRAPGGAWADPNQGERIKSLTPLERANYLASTRQFDQALDAYSNLLTQPNSVAMYFHRERAARSALAIAIRVRQDPDRALSIVEAYLKSPDVPGYQREVAEQWKASILKWKSERPRKEMTQEGLRAESIRLLAEARGQQKYPSDRSAEVLYLRASAVTHELLAQGLSGQTASEALLMAGMSYDVLDGLHLWDLQEPYFLACIKSAPHTEVSRQCFNRYEESVTLGLTGSSGTTIPQEVRKQLDRLKAEANPLPGVVRPN